VCCFSYLILQNDLSDIRQTRKHVGVFDLKRVFFRPDFLSVFEKGWYRVAARQCVHVVCVFLFKVTSLI